MSDELAIPAKLSYRVEQGEYEDYYTKELYRSALVDDVKALEQRIEELDEELTRKDQHIVDELMKRKAREQAAVNRALESLEKEYADDWNYNLCGHDVIAKIRARIKGEGK